MKQIKKLSVLLLVAVMIILTVFPATTSKALDWNPVPAGETIVFNKLYNLDCNSDKAYKLNIATSGTLTITISDKGSETWFGDASRYKVYDSAYNEYFNEHVGSNEDGIFSVKLCAGNYNFYIDNPRYTHHVLT